MGFVGGFTTAAALKMIDDGCKVVVDTYGDLPVADVFHTGFINGYKSRGLDPAKFDHYVKIPLAVGDYTSQAAQMASFKPDCLFGNIGEANWPPLITALDSVGASPRLYGPQGNLDGKVAQQYPEETNGGFVMNVVPEHRRPRVGRLPGRAREVQRAGPRLEQPRRPRHVGGVHRVHATSSRA